MENQPIIEKIKSFVLKILEKINSVTPKELVVCMGAIILIQTGIMLYLMHSINELDDTLYHYSSHIDSIRSTTYELKDQIEDVRKNLGYSDMGQIENGIAEINNRLNFLDRKIDDIGNQTNDIYRMTIYNNWR